MDVALKALNGRLGQVPLGLSDELGEVDRIEDSLNHRKVETRCPFYPNGGYVTGQKLGQDCLSDYSDDCFFDKCSFWK